MRKKIISSLEAQGMASKFTIALLTLLTLLTCPLLAETPEQAYRNFSAAAKTAQSFENLYPMVVASRVEKMKAVPQEKRERMFQMMKVMLPQNLEVLDTTVKDDLAILKCQADVMNPFVQKLETKMGNVKMRKVGGEWKYDHANWKDPR